MHTIRSGVAAAAMALAFGAMANPAMSATVLNVNWGDGCGKSTCFNEDGVVTRTFSARDFAGPITIGQLLMQRGVLGSLDSHMFRISFALNGEELGSWGHWNMAGIGGDELGFTGEAFTWNPEDGDLELILTLAPPPRAGSGGGFFASAPFVPDQEPFNEPQGGGEDDPGPGPLGAESPEPNAAIPEPATWALMISGFGLAGAALRRRRAIAVA